MLKSLLSNLATFITLMVALATLVFLGVVVFDLGSPAIRGLAGIFYQFFMLVNAFLMFFWLYKGSKRVALPAVVLLLSTPLLCRFYHLNFAQTKPKPEQFSVLSYNVLFVDNVKYIHGNKTANAKRLAAAMVNTPADIKCFQEFYNYDKIETFNFYPKFASTHPYKAIAREKIQVGLAIFSKYPIKNQKHIKFDYSNGLLWADIAIKGKICRVFNIQLNSMGIRLAKLATTQQAKAEQEAKIVASKLTEGFDRREREIAIVLAEIRNSPYPIVLCGDLNEVPFGRSYSSIAKVLTNTFEAKGSGFGLSLNRLPYLVRIDNQFFSPEIEPTSFKTLRDIAYSDHFPLKAIYQWK
jgi:endonuclease/exonuclease/phosphatase family metal-dependent hydrolase